MVQVTLPIEIYDATHYTDKDAVEIWEMLSQKYPRPIAWMTIPVRSFSYNHKKVLSANDLKEVLQSYWTERASKIKGYGYSIYNALYCTPYDKLPLLINDEKGADVIAAWRIAHDK